MAEFYKVLKANPLGEPYTPNMPGAKAIQSYWCQVEGQEKDVMIGKQVRDDGAVALSPGQHVYGDLMYAKSQKGNEYWKFKSAQVPEGVQRPADSPAQAQAQQAVGQTPTNMSERMPDWFMPVSNQIDYVYREIRKLSSENTSEQVAPIEPKAVQSEPISEDEMAVIDDIFSPPEKEN